MCVFLFLDTHVIIFIVYEIKGELLHMSKNIIATNPVAKHNYDIIDTLEAGLVLSGTEIKSIRNGKVNLKDSYAGIKNGEAYLYSMHISPYEQGNIFNKEPLRTRRLLLHKHEINKISGAITATGYTVVPLRVYFDHGLVKMDIGIAKGKKLYDKRQTIAKNDQRREAEKDFKIRNLGV